MEEYTCIDCGKVMPKSAEQHHRCPPTDEWQKRRHERLRRLLLTFNRDSPYIDNVTHRIIDWAKCGWRGEP